LRPFAGPAIAAAGDCRPAVLAAPAALSMSRAARLQLSLLTQVALLAAAVWWVQHGKAARQPQVTLLDLPVSAVTDISVQVRSGPQRRFARRNGEWQMLAPGQGRANQAHLKRLAAIAEAKVVHW